MASSRRFGLAVVLALTTATLGTGCDDARPQLLVVVDTNAPVVGQLAGDPAFSADSAIDALRVDTLDALGTQVFEPLDIAVPDVPDWPVSFGVASGTDDDGAVRLRIRAFRSALAAAGSLGDWSTVEPPAGVTIDRVIEVEVPDDDVVVVHVVLDAGCRGTRPVFGRPWTTCLTEGQPREPVAAGVEELDEEGDAPPTAVGTWPGAREVPCQGAPQDDRICIAGGFSILGDQRMVNVQDAVLDSAPMRPVRLSPFWLDRTEFTVGRFRQLVQQGRISGPLPEGPADDPNCRWLGESDASHDDDPLNCVLWQTAAEACREVAGQLPTEAQWEHAARGRGRGQRFPWGAEVPTCVTVSHARSTATQPGLCPGLGVEPAGSHQPAPDGSDPGDVSIDGVLDLAGSLTEHLADSPLAYADPCWDQDGVLQDPLCQDPNTPGHIARGGNWSSGIFYTQVALRLEGDRLLRFTKGFRCAYEDLP